ATPAAPTATGADPTSAATAALPDLPPFTTAVAQLVDKRGDGRPLAVYVADEPAERARGLMNLDALPTDSGMVFAFPDDHRGGFYMKDTRIPLSIAFFDAGGEVLAVLDMTPCRKDPCEIYDPGVAYRGALEVPAGYFDTVGLEPGWTVRTTPTPLPAS
ncbi:MAG: DUF192 domain-containing protein, partial [Actinomycetota bacterium]|nr:DUF192 domain-containing protein [Actinomycetota bacterium]